MHKFRATKSYVLEPNIFDSSGYNLLLVTLLEPRHLMLILHFWKISIPLSRGIVLQKGPTAFLSESAPLTFFPVLVSIINSLLTVFPSGTNSL